MSVSRMITLLAALLAAMAGPGTISGAAAMGIRPAARIAAMAGTTGASAAGSPGEGFAGTVSGGTRTVVFRDLDSLRGCLLASGSLCVPARAMTIQPGLRRLMVAGNVTLDGKGLLALDCDSYCLDLRSGNNRVTGVTFSGPGPARTLWPERFPNANCTDPQVPENLLGCAVPIHMVGASQVVIEGNSFRTCGDKCIAIDGGDAITIRGNRFADSYFGILAVGRPGQAATGHMTVAYNLFDRVFRRSARVSGAFVMHEYANVLTGTCPALPGGGFGPSAVGEAQALVEYNSADPGACASLEISAYDNAKTGVKAGAGKLLSRHNAGIADRDEAIGFAIPYDYPHRPLSADERAAIMAGGR